MVSWRLKDLHQAVFPVSAAPGRRGFESVAVDAYSVLLASPHLHPKIVYDPPGEVEVRVFRSARPSDGVWTYSETTGRATVERLQDE